MVWFSPIVQVFGVRVMLVNVWFTVTATALVAESEPSEIVTWKLYVPALLNVAVEFLDALVPLALNVTAAVNENAAQPFTATANDQFGTPLTTQPTFTWSVLSGGGSINSTTLPVTMTVNYVKVTQP